MVQDVRSAMKILTPTISAMLKKFNSIPILQTRAQMSESATLFDAVA
jgi:hypothetical protein